MIFAIDTNLFILDKNFDSLLKKNLELEKKGAWLEANKLSLNAKKPRFPLHHKITCPWFIEY